MMIKWSLQKGYICIPKSSKRERIIENADVFDFTISEEDMTNMVYTRTVQLYMLRPDSQFSPFQSQLACFEMGWPDS